MPPVTTLLSARLTSPPNTRQRSRDYYAQWVFWHAALERPFIRAFRASRRLTPLPWFQWCLAALMVGIGVAHVYEVPGVRVIFAVITLPIVLSLCLRLVRPDCRRYRLRRLVRFLWNIDEEARKGFQVFVGYTSARGELAQLMMLMLLNAIGFWLFYGIIFFASLDRLMVLPAAFVTDIFTQKLVIIVSVVLFAVVLGVFICARPWSVARLRWWLLARHRRWWSLPETRAAMEHRDDYLRAVAQQALARRVRGWPLETVVNGLTDDDPIMATISAHELSHRGTTPVTDGGSS